MDYILYHNNCPDGWCAAFICHMRYPEATFVPLNHGLNEAELEELFGLIQGRDVLMVDYSLRTRELNDKLNSLAKSFRILDHHKTARAVLEGASYAIFDMERSGAGLAWDYLFGKDRTLHPTDPTDYYAERPWWVNYTEDQDLWRWKLPRSREINAYLFTQERTIENWKRITDPNQMEAAMATRLGIGVRAHIEYGLRSIFPEMQEGVWQFEGRNYRTGVVNTNYLFASEMGEKIYTASYEIAVMWFERHDGVYSFSLRSNQNAEGGGVDVSTIAKVYGGGGHKNAAGFQVNLKEGRALIDWILGRGKYEPTSRCC